MRSRTFLPPRSLFGILATLAISVAVAGSSMHDHALDDGVEADVQVCVLAGTAVLPATDAPASVATAPPLVGLELPPVAAAAAYALDSRPPRARAPPAIEFGTL